MADISYYKYTLSIQYKAAKIKRETKKLRLAALPPEFVKAYLESAFKDFFDFLQLGGGCRDFCDVIQSAPDSGGRRVV